MKSLNTLIQIFQSFDEAIYIVDKNRKILFFNKIAEELTGFKKDDIVGKFCQNNTLNHIDRTGKSLCTKDCPLVKAMQENVVEEHSIFLHHKEGHRVPIKVKTIPYVEDGQIVGGIEVFSLLHKNRFEETYQKAINSLHLIDPLTTVFNRYFLDNHIRDIIEHNKFAYDLLFIDIDNFKLINDTFGHVEGDNILRTITNTFKANLTKDDYIIRYGGDEFLIFLKKSSQSGFEKAELLRILVEKTMRPEKNVNQSVSIGLRSLLEDESLLDTIIKADNALYDAKKTGKNKVVVAK